MTLNERHQEILEHCHAGLSYRKIGEMFGISPQRCSQIAIDSGLVRRLNTSIPDRVIEQAIRRYQKGIAITVIAEELGLSVYRIRRRLIAKGIHIPSDDRDTWNTDEIRFLKRHYKRGLSASQIASAIGRNRNEVIGKAYRLGLSKEGHR